VSGLRVTAVTMHGQNHIKFHTFVMLKTEVVCSVSASTVGVLVFIRWISTLEILPRVVCEFYSKHQKMLI
jgi:hypothetical protein